jgi:hypothetical protein
MENANQTINKNLAWAVLSKCNGSQLSQVIKILVTEMQMKRYQNPQINL